MYRAVNDLVTGTWKRCVVQSSAESRIVKYSEAQFSDRTWARYHLPLDYRSGNGMDGCQKTLSYSVGKGGTGSAILLRPEDGSYHMTEVDALSLAVIRHMR